MITSLILLWLLSPADLDYERGMALARRQQWAEAKAAFRRGQREAPKDKRFPLELAGLAFKQHDYEAAKRNIRRALRLDPHDAYANDFAGTLYLLDGNLEAALEYWNRIGKPRIGGVRMEPEPPRDPVLLDRAFAFAPETTLTLNEYRATRARLDLLDAFPAWTLELAPEPDGDDFDAVLHTAETRTWLTFFRGLPFETVYPELLNIGHQAIDIRSMLRFDKEKRRASFELSAPLARMPSWRYRLFFDGRNENWVIPDYGGFNMKRTEAGAEVASVIGGTWQWTSGTEFTHRSFTNSSFGPGDALEVRTALRAAMLRIPERRLSVSSGADWRLGRFFGQGEYSKLEGSVDARWFPRARGDDYETFARFRAGASGGAIPFDEFYFSAWSGIPISGCALTSAPPTERKAARRLVRTTCWPTGSKIRSFTREGYIR